VVTNPDSAFVVPYFENGDTMLVRQWRHAWDLSSWEVPAGTFDEGEEPLECARRELAEETGLVATRYRSLGVVHGAAFLTGRAHLFMAEGLTEAARAPETYEQDMEVLRLPFIEALNAALEGQIVHSGSVTALCRAARSRKLI
jgi:8-oxo-dGTP pyrophosphatase MutT (NUDIX family)